MPGLLSYNHGYALTVASAVDGRFELDEGHAYEIVFTSFYKTCFATSCSTNVSTHVQFHANRSGMEKQYSEREQLLQDIADLVCKYGYRPNL